MQNELLSAYIDGEQITDEITDALCQDEKLQQAWANYHTIRSVMRQEFQFSLGSDFSKKMEALIEQEESYSNINVKNSQPKPSGVRSIPLLRTTKKWFVPATQVAVAASVCLIAIMGVQTYNNYSAETAQNNQDAPVLQTLPFNNSVQNVSYSLHDEGLTTKEQLESQNRRISTMLQHYELQRRTQTNELNLGADQ